MDLSCPPPLIDIGANLSHESFAHDLADVLSAARSAGLEHLVVTGTSVATSMQAADLAATQPGLLSSTAGIHPHDATSFTSDSIQQLQQLAARPEVVAIGETGLDFYRDFSPREQQEQAFAEQLQLAVATGLPIFLHQRDAHTRFHHILREQRDHLSRGVVHCFTGTRQELFAYLDLDMYIGITGWICDERRGLDVLHLLPDIPPERLLLETDAPYLLPRNIRPKPKERRNVPANLRWVLHQVATRLDRPAHDIAVETTANARRFFAL